MSADRKDGGAAFPITDDVRGTDLRYKDCHGMSLRQWYAGQALSSGDCHHGAMQHDARARWAYRQADAMIAEGEK